YLCGFAQIHRQAFVRQTGDAYLAFLDGKYSLRGFRSFFPRAFIYKTPLPVLFLLLLGSIGIWCRWRYLARVNSQNREMIRREAEVLIALLAIVPIYGAAAIASYYNIGLRHILTIYPPLFIWCGASVYLFRTRFAPWAFWLL